MTTTISPPAAARLSVVDDRFADFAQETGVDHGQLSDAERTSLPVDIDAHIARAWGLVQTTSWSPTTPFYRSHLSRRLEELV